MLFSFEKINLGCSCQFINRHKGKQMCGLVTHAALLEPASLAQ